MKIKNNAKNGVRISIAILVIAIIITLIINIIPDVDVTKLNDMEKLEYKIGMYEAETPIWKKIGYIIVGILLVLDWIINLVMCRCNHCGKHIWSMNIFMKYCPYCSGDLDKTDE